MTYVGYSTVGAAIMSCAAYLLSHNNQLINNPLTISQLFKAPNKTPSFFTSLSLNQIKFSNILNPVTSALETQNFQIAVDKNIAQNNSWLGTTARSVAQKMHAPQDITDLLKINSIF